MKKGLLWQLAEYANKHRKKSRWQRIVTVMACVVVFCTTYALILPAITMEKTYECGKEEHTHTEECYTKVTTAARKEPACTLELHNHTEQCYNESGELICGCADFVVHTHNELCCDENGNLWCELPEIEGGTLDDSYYIVSEVQPVHEHTDECYALDENGNRTGELTCARTMVLEHQHTDECFRTVEESVDTEVLTCETEEHTHTEECFLIDGLTEEEWTQIDGADALINALPTRQEIEEKLTALEEVGDEEGYDAFLTQLIETATKAQAAYDALTEQQREKISDAGKLEDLAWLLTALPDGGDTVSSVLDGDFAYIKNLTIKERHDGTEPYDGSQVAGNDVSDSNDILRTFDLATYTLQFETALRPNANQAGYTEGVVYFEFILPVSPKEAEFDLGGMSWMETVKDCVHNIDKDEENGRQILRGHYTLTPSGGNSAAIGPGYSQVTVAIRALNMKNGDTITPQFSLWLEHNKEGDRKTVSHTLTISAAPQYNVELVRPFSTNTATGSYNFSTGDSSAPNKGMGPVKGYLMGFGLTVQLRSDRNRGLLGMELPDESTRIAFDLDLSSVYKAQGEVKNEDGDYRLLLWSGGGNSDGDAQERTTNALQTAIVSAPYNEYQNQDPKAPYEYNSCNNGGTWTFEQRENSIHVTVTGFQLDASRFPYGTSLQNNTIYKYYTPGQGWGGITEAVFSAGEFWLLQPVESLNDQTQIDKTHGAGQFDIKVTEKNLMVNNASTDQTRTDDDAATLNYRLGGGGTINVDLTYNQYRNTNYDGSLIDKSHLDDSDWAALGQNITLRAQLTQTGADGGGVHEAADLLLKFDGNFFEPDSTNEDRTMNTKEAPVYVPSSAARARVSYYWAVKPDGSNWANDEEMKRATEDDLIYYKTLAEIPEGHIPVALLLEVRGHIGTDGGSYPVCINGKIKETSQPGEVYMMTRSTLIWTRNDVAAALGKTVDELTDAECSNYVKNILPSRNPDTGTGANKRQLSNDGTEWLTDSAYLEPTIRQDYYTTGELTKCTKATYDTGYHPGFGPQHFQDSCLVVPYRSTITKSTAQKMNDDTPKTAYGISQNQRVVDFVLQPKIQGYLAVGEATGVTKTITVTVRDVLPAQLLYLNNTAYLGGTYQQDPNCEKPGTVTGGQALEPVMTTENGQTVLTWTFSTTVDLQAERPNSLGPIYFSCLINEDAVKGSQMSFANVATVMSSGEQFRGYDKKHGNLVDFSVTVNRIEGASITKLADQHNADWWEPVGFLMNAGNNSTNALSDTLITDTLPAKDKNDGTIYDGPLVVTELLLGAKTTDSATGLMNNLQFYYTTNTAYAGLTGAELRNTLNKQSGQTWQEYLDADTANWHKLTAPTEFASQGGEWYGGRASGLPTQGSQEGAPITAIVAAGTLPASQTLKMHITVKLPQGKADDNLVNYLSMSVGDVNLRTFATTKLVSRSLSGLTWMDVNADGIRDEGETLLSGVKVNLLKLKDGAADLTDINSYEPFHYGNDPANEAVTIVTGQSVSAQNKNVVSQLEEGNYKFTELPSGIYAVQFTSDTDTKIDFLTASPENQGNDDTVDSDGVPAYDNNENLQHTLIADIDLRDQGGKPDSPHNDSGFYRNGPELPQTGGRGREPYIISGLMIICVCGFLLYSNHKRRAEYE